MVTGTGRLVGVALAIAFGVGCARTAPPARSQEALYRDLERLVTLTDAAGWGIDRLEVEGLLPEALDSLCRVERAERQGLLMWIDAEIMRRGGPLEVAWQRAGQRLGSVDDLLTLTRIRMTLDHAMTSAEGDCPFWMAAEAPFRGRQISDDRWQVTAGGGGKAILVRQGGKADVNVGGAGRLLIGRSFGSRAALYGGFELGASASFPKDDQGERTALIFGFDLVTPVVYRHTLTNTYVEGEVGWLGHFIEDQIGEIEHGVHVGVSMGGRGARKRLLFPGAAFGISWERTFPRADQGDPRTTIKLGFRVALDVDL